MLAIFSKANHPSRVLCLLGQCHDQCSDSSLSIWGLGRPVFRTLPVSGLFYSMVCLISLSYCQVDTKTLMNACRFMPADALWTFAMACNVYLTFFRKYDASRLRSLEWKYAIMCYGVPFIPSFVYFFIKSDSKGPIYGSAVVSLLTSKHLR